MRAAGVRIAVAAAVAIVAAAVAPETAVAAPESSGTVRGAVVAVVAPGRPAPETVPACRFEDGSGQAVCVWDARHLGNGRGRSFVAIRGGRDSAVYRDVSHRTAHRLLYGAR